MHTTFWIILSILDAAIIFMFGWLARAKFAIPADITIELFQEISPIDIDSLSRKVWADDKFTAEEKDIMCFLEVHRKREFPKAPFI